MKKLFSWIMAIAVMASCFSFAPSLVSHAEDEAYFYEDFEIYEPGAYPTSFSLRYNGTGTANQKVIVSNDYKGNPGKVFRLQGASSWASEHLRALPSTMPETLIIQSYVKPVSGSWPGRIGLYNRNIGTWGTRVTGVLFESGNRITALRNSRDNDKVQIGTYSMGTWYKVTMIHDMVNYSYDVKINDVLVAEDLPISRTIPATHLNLTAGNIGVNEIYYDNVGIYGQDTTAPAISSDYTKGAASMEVTATDSGSGISEVTYQIGGGAVQTAVLNDGRFTISSLPEGKYDVTITATDGVGNQGTLTVPVASLYTVTFRSYEGSTDNPLKTEIVEYGNAATPPADPSRTGFVFTGWDKTYSVVASDTTIYGKWAIGGITVTPYQGIYDGTSHDAAAVEGTLPGDVITFSTDGSSYAAECPKVDVAGIYPVFVKVSREGYAAWKSQEETAEVAVKALTEDMAAAIASCEFTGNPLTPTPVLADGPFSLSENKDYSVAYQDNTGIGLAKVTITGMGNYTGAIIRRFAIYEKRTDIQIDRDAISGILVSGLEKLYLDQNIYTPDDRMIEREGGTVTIQMAVGAVSGDSSDRALIEAAAGNKSIGVYLDLSVYKMVTKYGETAAEKTRIHQLSEPLAIQIPVPDSIKGKEGIALFRVHNGEAAMIPLGEGNAVDGEYFTMDDNDISLHAKKFSTYAIGYDTAQTAAIVNPETASPATGDGGNPFGWTAVILMACLIIYRGGKSIIRD